MLAKRLDRVARDGRGVAVTIRGRRQVGKSRLVQEFIDRAGRPSVGSPAWLPRSAAATSPAPNPFAKTATFAREVVEEMRDRSATRVEVGTCRVYR